MSDVALQNPASTLKSQRATRVWILLFAVLLPAFATLWTSQHVEFFAQLREYWIVYSGRAAGLLPEVNESSPFLWILFPALMMFGLASLLLLVYAKPPFYARVLLFGVFLVLQAGYLVFRLVATLNFDTTANAVVGVLFYFSELFIHLRIALGNLYLLNPTDRSRQADASEQLIESGEYLPAVDVFVPTYSEPVEILRRTIIGCQEMDYPRMTVWLLDDQRRPVMRQLAAELGCRYLDRPDNRHAKAGNLNHALQKATGELMLCFDADFVPTRNFLRRTVGFFQDPEVAMVQTPQNFFNEDAVMRNLGVEHAVEDEQKFFFRALQPGRDAANAIVCHGSCFVARRSAIDEIGGIPTETITEDWATSIKLQAAGYKLYYLNEALSAGLSADTSGEFVQQRTRWSQGTLQGLYATTNPLRVKGLNWKQRLLHFSGILYYAGFASSVFNLIAPLLYLFGGVLILQMTIPEMLFFRLPFAIAYYMLFSWLTLRTRSALWTEFYDAFLAPSMTLSAVRSFFKPFGVGFRVTDKTAGKKRLGLNRRTAMPFAVLLVLHVAGLAYAMATHRNLEDPSVFVVVAWYTVSNLMMLWMCVLVSMDVAQDRPFKRFEHRLPFRLRWEGGVVTGGTVLVSEGDAVLGLSGSELPKTVTGSLYLSLPTLLADEIPVRIIEPACKGGLSVEFQHLTLPQRRALVAHLFCRPGQWDKPAKSELRAAWAFVVAGFRMHPLVNSK